MQKSVIDIFTKKELTELPFKKRAARDIVKHLLNFKSKDFMRITMEERVIIDSILRYVANASGANANEIFVKALTEIEPDFGDAS